jgi:hypothetical protein
MTTSTIRARRVGPLVVVSGLPKTHTATRAPRRKPTRRTDAMILCMPRWLAFSLLALVIVSCIGVH